jgi:hypothetical protein
MKNEERCAVCGRQINEDEFNLHVCCARWCDRGDLVYEFVSLDVDVVDALEDAAK